MAHNGKGEHANDIRSIRLDRHYCDSGMHHRLCRHPLSEGQKEAPHDMPAMPANGRAPTGTSAKGTALSCMPVLRV